MWIVAIVLYILGMPLAAIICKASLNAEQNKFRARLGIPPVELTGIDNVAMFVASAIWPVLGVVAIAGGLFNPTKGKTSDKA